MKRLILLLSIMALPLAAFAQSAAGQARETNSLKQRLGLNDTQVSQVLDIQKTTFETVQRDRVHARLLQAEISEALLPQSVDQAKVNELIDQVAQTRADMEKALVGARIQLRSIMSDGAFATYMQLLRQRFDQARYHRAGRYGDRYAPRAPQAWQSLPNPGGLGNGFGDGLVIPWTGPNFGLGH